MQFQLNRKTVLVSAVAFSIQASLVQAAGFSVNEQSASTMGSAYAGRASHAEDASIASSNPAGIAFLDRQQVTLGSAVIIEGGEFEGKYTHDASSRSSKNFQQTTPVPFGHYALPINDKLSFGLSGYAPFGIHLDYDDQFAGRYFGDKTEFSVMNLQGTVAYKIQDNLSLGFGIIGSYVKGDLTQKVRLGPGMEANGRVEGDDMVVAWNAGILWQASEQTALGLAYHSTLDFKLSGTSEATSAIPQANYKHQAEVALTMPERVMLSATHQINNQWTVMADATWTRWSRFEEFKVVDKEGGANVYVPENWKNTWALSVGTAYKINNQWTLKAGYMFDQSPVDDDNRTVRTPDADRNWFTAGAKWDISQDLTLDFSYAYVTLQDGKIHEQKHNDNGQTVPAYGSVTGEYKNNSHILSAQMTYRF